MKIAISLLLTLVLCLSLCACGEDAAKPTDTATPNSGAVVPLPSGSSKPSSNTHIHTPSAAATCTEDQKCTVCGEILAVATGHIEVVDNAVAATCTSTGLTEGAHCSVCNAILKQQEVIPETHSLYQHKCTQCGYEEEKLASFDVSPNKDGSVLAHLYKTNIEDEYLIAIYGTGAMRDYNISSRQTPYESLCNKIKYIEIGEGITKIGDDAFACWGYGDSVYEIKQISLPSTLVEIGNGAFEEVRFIDDCEFVIPNSVTKIGGWAFEGAKMNKLELHDGITEIGSYAFTGATIHSFKMGEGITSIGEYAFSKKPSIGIGFFETSDTTSYENGIYVGSLNNPYYMLVGVKNKEITSLEIHPDTHMICSDAVYECIFLQQVTIPEKVQFIGEYAFGNCLNLKTVDIQGKLKYLTGHIFYGCENLTTISLPDTLEKIGHLNFAKCLALSRIVFNGQYAQWEKVVLEKGWGSIDPWDSKDKEFSVTLQCTDKETTLRLPQVTIGH